MTAETAAALRFVRRGDSAEVRADGGGLNEAAVADCEWQSLDVAEGISPGWLVTLRRIAGQSCPVEGERMKYDTATDLIEALRSRMAASGPWWTVPGNEAATAAGKGNR